MYALVSAQVPQRQRTRHTKQPRECDINNDGSGISLGTDQRQCIAMQFPFSRGVHACTTIFEVCLAKQGLSSRRVRGAPKSRQISVLAVAHSAPSSDSVCTTNVVAPRSQPPYRLHRRISRLIMLRLVAGSGHASQPSADTSRAERQLTATPEHRNAAPRLHLESVRAVVIGKGVQPPLSNPPLTPDQAADMQPLQVPGA